MDTAAHVEVVDHAGPLASASQVPPTLVNANEVVIEVLHHHAVVPLPVDTFGARRVGTFGEIVRLGGQEMSLIDAPGVQTATRVGAETLLGALEVSLMGDESVYGLTEVTLSYHIRVDIVTTEHVSKVFAEPLKSFEAFNPV